jgi:hypothetical protein
MVAAPAGFPTTGGERGWGKRPRGTHGLRGFRFGGQSGGSLFSIFSNYSNTLQGSNFEIRNQNLPEVQNFPNLAW